MGQRTVEGAICSSCSLDKGVSEELNGVTLAPSEGDLVKRSGTPYQHVFHPLLYQDDVFKVNADRNTAQEANNRIEKVIESKLLTLNLDKSCYIVMGAKKPKQNIKQVLSRNPLYLCGKVMMA